MESTSETKVGFKVVETKLKIENPMQERHFERITRKVDLLASEVFTARKLRGLEDTEAVRSPEYLP